MIKINRNALIAAAVAAIVASVAIPASVAVNETRGVADIVGQIEKRNERIAMTRLLIGQVSDIQQSFLTVLLDVDIEPIERARIGAAIRELTKLGSPLDRLLSISTHIISPEEQVSILKAAEVVAHSWEDISREGASALGKDEAAFHFLQIRDSIRAMQTAAEKLGENFSHRNRIDASEAIENLKSSAAMLQIIIVGGLAIAVASFCFLFVVFRAIRRAGQDLRNSEATLAAQNSRFKAALENMRHGLSMYDAENRLEVFNRRYLEIYGLNESDVKISMCMREMRALRKAKGHHVSIIEGGEFGSLFDPSDNVAGGPLSTEFQRDDERIMDVNGRHIRVTRTQRAGGGWVVMHADITEQRRVQKALEARDDELSAHNQRFRDLLEGLPHGLSMFDANRRLVICNRPYMELYGLAQDRVAVGMTFEDIVGDIRKRGILRGVTDDDDDKFDSGHVSSGPTTAIYEFNDGRFSLMSRFPRPSGGWVAFHEDISRRVLAEREREAALLDAARSREQERAAESTSRAKSAFLAMMSHEIRTPMNAVVGLSSALLDTKLDGEQRHVASTIHESSNILLHLLNDILDISKLDAGKVEFEAVPFAMVSLVDHVASIVSARASEKGLTIRAAVDSSVPPAVIGDLGRLRQVVLNLVSNAIKFTEAGVVEITARCLDEANGRATIEIAVRDTGIGISPEQLDKLFNEFTQADAAINRKYGGTGLGLAISKKIVTQMGGGIRVESIPGVGSTFLVTLELPVTGVDTLGHARRGADIRELAPILNSRIDPLRILLAEDNVTNQLVFSKLTQSLKVDIVIAENGHEAVSLAYEQDFDVVFMDMRMPGMDGLAATRAIRAFEGSRSRVLIIALTANAFADDVKACRDAGMDDFLAKPLRKAVLFEKLANLVTSERADIPPVSGGKGHAPAPTLALPTTPSAEVAISDVAPILDRVALANLIAEIEFEGVRAALDMFVRELLNRIALLQTLSCDDDRIRIKGEAHTLMGAAGTFGMLQLADLARTLEQEAHAITSQRYCDLIARIDAAFRLARDEAEFVLAETPMM